MNISGTPCSDYSIYRKPMNSDSTFSNAVTLKNKNKCFPSIMLNKIMLIYCLLYDAT